MKASQAANLVPNLSSAPREYKWREIEETRGNRLVPSLALFYTPSDNSNHSQSIA